MGIASSQARYLMLTARKSDLEYRAQVISQRKINLSMQTEQLATDYSNALTNRKMTFTYGVSGTNVTSEDLSYAGLTGINSQTVGDYLVKTADGAAVASYSKDADGNYSIDDAWKIVQKLAKEAGGSKEERVKNIKTTDEVKQIVSEYVSAGKIKLIAGLDNNRYFQDALRNGNLYIYKYRQNDETGAAGYESVSWSGMSEITDAYDTSDDAAAEAEYEAKSLVLENQDKRLDLELKQLETQQSAAKNELDALKTLIKDNVDKGFKYFS